ncbi:hypothetical protein GF373_07910, partial [bacterium]|nr:hypothetical protein [bacterium]
SDRIKYVKMLEAQTLSKALEDYRRMTRDPNAKVRATAIMGFKRIDDEETRFKLVKQFYDDSDGRVRANAIELLPDTKPDNQEMISIAKKASNSEIRREKANALAKLLNWEFYEYEKALLEMLDSDDEWTRTSALWVIGVTNLPHLIDRLRDAANDKRSHVREMAVRGIGIKGSEDDLRALMPFLQDPDRNVRLATQKALRSRLHLSFEVA